MALESSFYLALPSFTWFYLIWAYLYLIVVLPSFTQFYLVKRSSGFFFTGFCQTRRYFWFWVSPKVDCRSSTHLFIAEQCGRKKKLRFNCCPRPAFCGGITAVKLFFFYREKISVSESSCSDFYCRIASCCLSKACAAMIEYSNNLPSQNRSTVEIDFWWRTFLGGARFYTTWQSTISSLLWSQNQAWSQFHH